MLCRSFPNAPPPIPRSLHGMCMCVEGSTCHCEVWHTMCRNPHWATSVSIVHREHIVCLHVFVCLNFIAPLFKASIHQYRHGCSRLLLYYYLHDPLLCHKSLRSLENHPFLLSFLSSDDSGFSTPQSSKKIKINPATQFCPNSIFWWCHISHTSCLFIHRGSWKIKSSWKFFPLEVGKKLV